MKKAWLYFLWRETALKRITDWHNSNNKNNTDGNDSNKVNKYKKQASYTGHYIHN